MFIFAHLFVGLIIGKISGRLLSPLTFRSWINHHNH